MPPIFRTFCTNFRTFSSEILHLHVTDYPDLQHRLQNIHLQESSLVNVLNTRTSSVSAALPVLGCLNGIQFLSSHCKMAQQAQPVEDVAVTDSSRVQTEHKYHFTIPLSGDLGVVDHFNSYSSVYGSDVFGRLSRAFKTSARGA